MNKSQKLLLLIEEVKPNDMVRIKNGTEGVEVIHSQKLGWDRRRDVADIADEFGEGPFKVVWVGKYSTGYRAILEVSPKTHISVSTDELVIGGGDE